MNHIHTLGVRIFAVLISFPEIFLMITVSLGSGVIFPLRLHFLISSFVYRKSEKAQSWGRLKSHREQVLADSLGRRNIPPCPSLNLCDLDSHMALYFTESETSYSVPSSLDTDNEECQNVPPRKTNKEPQKAKCKVWIHIADLNRKDALTENLLGLRQQKGRTCLFPKSFCRSAE